MRNLYKRLKVSQTATPDKIREAIRLCQDESVRRDADRVLLNVESRAVYDRNLELLRTIARARLALGLLQTPNWGEDLRIEFAEVPASVAQTATEKRSSGGCGWGGLTFLALVVCLIGYLSYYHSEASQYKRAASADTVAAYEGFLKRNPNGSNAESARRRLRQFDLEAKWNSYRNSLKKYGDSLDPTSTFQIELFEFAKRVIRESTASDLKEEATIFLNNSRSRFEGQLASSNHAIQFYRLFPGQDAALLLMEQFESTVQSSRNDSDLEAILSFLKDIDRLPGVSKVRIDPLRKRASERFAERYRDFDFVRRLDTKEAYELYLRQISNGPDAERARRRIIDLEVDEILKGDVGALPELQPVGSSSTSPLASVEVSNDTIYNLTVRYSGRDSQKHVVAPHQKKTFEIRKGEYRVTATVDAGNVRAYAGNETITYDQYGVSFYIITTQF